MAVAEACTIIIAAAELLPALEERTATSGREMLAFSEKDTTRALEEIFRRRPGIIALELTFAATPRGAALIDRVNADPKLSGCELHVVSLDGGDVRVLPRPIAADAGAAASDADIAAVGVARAAAPAPPLDQRGTRRAPRVRIAAEITLLVDGNATRLIDLSVVGAQVIAAAVLKPNQRVRLALSDERGALRFNGAVAWAFFEIPEGRRPHYRAGISFADADADAVDAFCHRHKHAGPGGAV